ncbi:9-hexadecenoic acid cis-trans isomerase [Malaciobacter pacificus]|uniref:Fatty acid cis/trans isomerase n=1 Tax=Malaciobacter pacificus TaxID=1080223 RepID=A0A5C2H8Q7_9BACT|nr:fatty acid cis/trans isomerase [Malaciobacter pacificus]QEP35317.1 fatty acid cis/trans isomerase [Malaciobacter pacificus]GGD42043.1 9-hexadecenoic acid cis-trans isomerase [Malaciobacter pacificus]
MKLQIPFFLLIFLFFTKTIFANENAQISYIKDIKPILDNRCVTCHSCYNSPCQLKLSSFEGLKRGANKESIYENRLKAITPSRLFVDALNEKQWREKNFYSVSDTLEDLQSSIMIELLKQKQNNPLNKGTYSPETDELSCIQNKNELNDYLEEKPYHGMPYGFPVISQKEHNLLTSWLKQKDLNSDEEFEILKNEKDMIERFENFFNNSNIKNQVSARYIYEHLFLAHISFDKNSNNFFELVRAKNKTGPVQIIATRFPYDKIEDDFYYRFRLIKSTIVHKTHMVYEMNDEKLKRYNELFIKPKWIEKPYMPPYDSRISTNALKTFKQIPSISRYQFLLDDIHYVIMTYIRGPVCKGQIALNVINDHFWVMFMDPKYDLAVKNKYYLDANLHNLSIPNKYGDNPNLIETFSVVENYEQAVEYYKSKNAIYNAYYKNGIPFEAIWKGNQKEQNDAILTIYRHFDSASVHKGALGDIPRTLWLIDFPLLERLYYSLVAGFDVFGSTQHQFLVRKHMDRLRIEGETNFLEFLPKESRKEYFNSWYKGWIARYFTYYVPSKNQTSINYETTNYKKEFVNKVLKYTNTELDKINYIKEDYRPSNILENYENIDQINETLKMLTLPNNSKLIQNYTNDKSNLAYIKIELNDGNSLIYSMVINRWHDNVALMFDEEGRLDAKKDRINFIKGFIGSYPNIFVVVKQNELSDFFNLIYDYQDTKEHKKRLLKYAINRANPKFWDVYDWFTNEFKKQDKLKFGLFDLNRYYDKAINDLD